MSNTPLQDANVRATHYFLARSFAGCRHCGSRSPVFALLLPRGHETADPDDGIPPCWIPARARALLSSVALLSIPARRRLARLAPRYRENYSPGLRIECWLNHCECCGAVLDEQTLHEEPGGAFVPLSPEQAREITLLTVADAIEAEADGYALAPSFYEFATPVR
jgi:hypothetical protein